MDHTLCFSANKTQTYRVKSRVYKVVSVTRVRTSTICAIPNLPLIYSNSVPNLLVITRLMRGYRRSDLMSQHKQLDEILATALISTETPTNRKKKLNLLVYEAFTMQACAKPRASAGYYLLPLY